jgi:hypothetical protein
MPDYKIVLDPVAAGGPVKVTDSPVELDPEALYALGDQIAEDLGPGWGATVEGVYRTDLGTLIERPES